jgi:hypothetical protein
MVLAAVVGVVDDRTLRLPRPGGVAARFLPEITPSGMRCRLLPISAATPRIPISASPAEQGAAPGPTARHPFIHERLRWRRRRDAGWRVLWGGARGGRCVCEGSGSWIQERSEARRSQRSAVNRHPQPVDCDIGRWLAAASRYSARDIPAQRYFRMSIESAAAHPLAPHESRGGDDVEDTPVRTPGPRRADHPGADGKAHVG